MEAQRVMNCLEDTLERLDMLTRIPCEGPDAALLGSLTRAGATPVRSALESEWQLEEGHQALSRRLSSRESARSQSAKPKRTASKISIASEASAEVLGQLHQVIRGVCRQFKKSPTALQILYSTCDAEARSASFVSFLNTLSELVQLVLRELSATVEEKMRKAELANDILMKERAAEDERDALTKMLKMQRAQRKRELTANGDLIKRFRGELDRITKENEAEIANIESETKKTMDIERAEHEATKKKNTEIIGALAKKLRESRENNAQSETQLRKKKENMEGVVTDQIKMYDVEMTAKQTEIMELKEVMKQEQLQLQQLEKYFEKIDRNKAQQNKEETALAEFKRRIQEAMQKLDLAAAQIQKRIRGKNQFLEYQKMKSKKKKGGKKGKKGKKKK